MIKEFKEIVDKYNFKYRDGESRPWGSWDLIILNPLQPGWLQTGQTFGWGYSHEQGFLTFLSRIADKKFTDEQFKIVENYFGKEVLNEFLSILKNPEIDETIRQIPLSENNV
jgi:hypothetical protein